MTNVAVALIGALSLFNLMLTFAVIRQVRRFGEQYVTGGTGKMSTGQLKQPEWHIQAGSPIPEFTADTVPAGSISLSDLTGARSIVGFFSVGCAPCRVQIPEFVRYATSLPGGAAQAVAVMVDRGNTTQEQTDEYIRELRGAAAVVIERLSGPVTRAFSVSGYPTFYVLDERGRVEASGMAVRRVEAAVAL